MNESFSAFARVLTAVLWGPHVLLLILLAGVWFTLRGRFMQVTKLPGMTRGALCGTQRCGGFSAFQSLTASLAGSLGTGNILGVAAAILVGGAGAVVWMWIAAFFGMMTVYAEGVLAAWVSPARNAPGAIGWLCSEGGGNGAKFMLQAVGAFGARMAPAARRRGIVGAGAHGSAARACGRCICGAFAPLRARRPAESRARHGKACAVYGGAVFMPVPRCPSARLAYIPWRGGEHAESGAFSLKAGAGGVCGMILAA